jgi:mutator family transposase
VRPAQVPCPLDAEVDRLRNAQRYERTEARRDTRGGHNERGLQTKASDVTLKVPKLRHQTFETAIIERYRRWEASVEEALIEMYLAGVSVRRVEDTTEALGGTRVSPSTVSDFNKKIYETIETWRNRPIAGERPPPPQSTPPETKVHQRGVAIGGSIPGPRLQWFARISPSRAIDRCSLAAQFVSLATSPANPQPIAACRGEKGHYQRGARSFAPGHVCQFRKLVATSDFRCSFQTRLIWAPTGEQAPSVQLRSWKEMRTAR